MVGNAGGLELQHARLAFWVSQLRGQACAAVQPGCVGCGTGACLTYRCLLVSVGVLLHSLGLIDWVGRRSCHRSLCGAVCSLQMSNRSSHAAGAAQSSSKQVPACSHYSGHKA